MACSSPQASEIRDSAQCVLGVPPAQASSARTLSGSNTVACSQLLPKGPARYEGILSLWAPGLPLCAHIISCRFSALQRGPLLV